MGEYNVKLFAALKERGLNQTKFAQIVGENPTQLSRVINGIWNIDDASKTRYARVLGVKVRDIFGEKDDR